MALIYHDVEQEKQQKIYMDRKYFSRYEDQVAALRESKWVYVGNLSFHTSEAQLYSLCTRVGPVRRVIMGLNSRLKTPCGFAFAEFYEANDALEAVAVLSETVLDDMQIRVELDFGYKNGRHFGRGQTGGQVRDDRRVGFDPGRQWAADGAASRYGPGGGGGGGESTRSGGGGDRDRSGRDDIGRDARRSGRDKGGGGDDEEERGRRKRRVDSSSEDEGGGARRGRGRVSDDDGEARDGSGDDRPSKRHRRPSSDSEDEDEKRARKQPPADGE